MIRDDIFERALIEPARDQQANKLYIVSGYASPAMVQTHFTKLDSLDLTVEINLIIGMAPLDAVNQINHFAFQSLMESTFKGRFFCSYVNKLPRVHSKVYSWFKDHIPVTGFVGSSNYTQVAFLGNNQLEVLQNDDPIECRNYYNELIPNALFCTHNEASLLVHERRVQDLSDKAYRFNYASSKLNKVTVSLLTSKGKMGLRSSLNWGQRENRNKNQAYIPLVSKIASSDFFPPNAQHFTVLTDDDKTIIMTKAQGNGKALHSPENNSILGEYFRNRLGLDSGAFVRLSDLVAYGRSDVTFYKIDDETYYMDFSV